MRLLCVAFVAYISSSAVASDSPSPLHRLRLPELPERDPQAFYYWQVMTAHEHGRVVTTAEGAPLKLHLAVKIIAGAEDAVIVIREASDYSNCERLTGLRVTHYNSPSGHHIVIKDRLRNAEGQEFAFSWRYNPNSSKHYLHRFVIYLPESTPTHPINFIAKPKENPSERLDLPPAKIAEDYFSGTNPNCN